MTYREQRIHAEKTYKTGMLNVKNNPEPKGQKFHVGERVHICRGLGDCMSHFPSDIDATVLYTYAHAFSGNNITAYALDVDGWGNTSWYEEWQLSRVGDNNVS